MRIDCWQKSRSSHLKENLKAGVRMSWNVRMLENHGKRADLPASNSEVIQAVTLWLLPQLYLAPIQCSHSPFFAWTQELLGTSASAKQGDRGHSTAVVKNQQDNTGVGVGMGGHSLLSYLEQLMLAIARVKRYFLPTCSPHFQIMLPDYGVVE